MARFSGPVNLSAGAVSEINALESFSLSLALRSWVNLLGGPRTNSLLPETGLLTLLLLKGFVCNK